MSSRAQLARVPADRRAHAAAVLGGFVCLRVSPASLLALVDAAADALADRHVGAARDLLNAICSAERADQILIDMLDDEAPALRVDDGRELGA